MSIDDPCLVWARQQYQDDPSDRFPDDQERAKHDIWTLPARSPLPPRVDDTPATRTAERVAELRAMRYHDYLRTPEWLDVRKHALKHAENRCRRCRTQSEQLDVHHRTYDRLGCELPGDLEVLCRSCHEKEHGL